MKDGSKVLRLHHRAKDFSGQEFGHLTAIAPAHSDGKKRSWEYRCRCGQIVTKVGADVTKEVKRGGTPNCGCLTRQLMSEKLRRHGMSSHPAFAVWRSMLDRCRLPSHRAWKNYGGRGICVCQRWQDGFENFWADMGPTYQRGLSLDRRSNDGPYSPENCRWVNHKQQANNQRRNVIISTPDGDMTVAQASQKYGIGATTIFYRIAHRWPVDKLLINPDYTNRVSTIL